MLETDGAHWSLGSIETPACETDDQTQKRTEEDELDERTVVATATTKAKKSVSRSHEKLAKSKPKRTGNRPRSDLGRFGGIKVVQGTATDAPKTARDGLRTPSCAILALKLGVLAAMLVVLDAKLAARDGPDDARSRPRALFERVRKLERCSYRFFVGF